MAFFAIHLGAAALDVATTDGSAPRLTNEALMAALADLAHANQSMTARLLGASD